MMYGFSPFSPLMRGCREGCPLDPAGSDMIGPVLILPATCVQPKPRVPERKGELRARRDEDGWGSPLQDLRVASMDVHLQPLFQTGDSRHGTGA
ncbi:hypothetical protein BDQ94DRAFT_132742, partial [Aspergillus welwitschiae]